MGMEILAVKDVFMKIGDGEYEQVSISPVEIECTDEYIDGLQIECLKEASFTTELDYNVTDLWVQVISRFVLPNNWLKMHGIPKRTKFEKNLCASRKRRYE